MRSAAALRRRDGPASMLPIVLAIVPLVNVLSVAMLVRFGHGARPMLIGTARLMAGIITVQTGLALITLPAALTFLV